MKLFFINVYPNGIQTFQLGTKHEAIAWVKEKNEWGNEERVLGIALRVSTSNGERNEGGCWQRDP